MSLDFASLAAKLLGQARSILPEWFPAGRWQGHEFAVGNLSGEKGDSLKINETSGAWSDFATGEAGGDLISLYAAMCRVSNGDAYKQLAATRGNDPLPPTSPPKSAPQWTPLVPVPVDAGNPSDTFHHRGPDGKTWTPRTAVARWAYHTREGALVGYVVRFEWVDGGARKKDIVPQCYCELGNKREWRWRSFLSPRPLYKLHDLTLRDQAPVLIVEGEKCADAIATLAPQYAGTTWPGGAKAWRRADFTPLKGRQVLLWPDADKPGVEAMYGLAHYLLKLCPSVKMIFPSDGEQADGWDAADALADGWNWPRLKAWALSKVKVITEDDHGNDSVVGEVDARAAMDRARGAGDANEGAGAGALERDESSVDRGLAQRPHGGGAEHERGGRDAARAPARGVEGGSAFSRGTASRTSGASSVSPSAASFSTKVNWLEWGLDRNGNGAPLVNLANVVRVMQNDANLLGLVYFDTFLNRLMCARPEREWTDADDIGLMLYLQERMELLKVSQQTVRQAVLAVARANERNCVRDWLKTLQHDGVPRIDTFFPDIFNCSETTYSRALSKNFWLGMVARVYSPGCKVDNMVILEGAQGIYKSTALDLIASPWFAEQHESATNPKAFAEVLAGKLIVEISEMDAFTRAETTRVKQIISCRSDRYRDSYGHKAEDHPRQGIIVASTNKDDYNKDETGARRMWPIACRGDARIDLVKANREQYFAEAVSRYENGEPWWVMPAEETRAEQDRRYDADVWTEAISTYLSGRPQVTINELLLACIGIELPRVTRTEQKRVAAILRHLGWINQGNTKVQGSVVKVWKPGSDAYGEVALPENDATFQTLPENDVPF